MDLGQGEGEIPPLPWGQYCIAELEPQKIQGNEGPSELL